MTQKITFGRRKGQNETDRDNAMRYQENPYVTGISGVGDIAAATKDPVYGANTVDVAELIDPAGNKSQPDAPANAPLPVRQTGDAELANSETVYPNGMTEMAPDRLEQKLAMYRKALGNAGDGNNNRAETGSLS